MVKGVVDMRLSVLGTTTKQSTTTRRLVCLPGAMTQTAHVAPRVGRRGSWRANGVDVDRKGEEESAQEKSSWDDAGEDSSLFEDRVEMAIARAAAAQRSYSHFTQKQVDAVFKNAALEANMSRIPLAKMAVQETGIGLVEDKVIKNHFASEEIYNKYKDEKTVGVVEEDAVYGIQKVAEPMGVLCGIVPTTNPTSTAIFKCLLALKTRNAIVLAPHPRASDCTIAAAKIVHDAAVKAGAPPGIIGWIEHPSKDETFQLMKSPKVSMIIATGGPAMVHSSYSSGTPAIGVGAGNTPAIVDSCADIHMAVNYILLSKTFDNGVICASEQAAVVLENVYDAFKFEMERRGAHILSESDTEKVRQGLFPDGRMNADAVGKSAYELAQLFGLDGDITDHTRLLIAPIDHVGGDEVLSSEKLCPILGLFCAKTFDDALEIANNLVENGGKGHTSVIYSNNRKHIEAWENTIQTVRMLVNMPSSQGAIGDLYNNLDPSLTLGCGSYGNTSVSTNVGPKHLLNFKTVAQRRENMLWFRVPPKVYFKEGCLEVALRELQGKKRAFIVTDKPLYDLGYVDKVVSILESIHVHAQIFYHVKPDPDIETIQAGAKELSDYQADAIIALGGGSPMDAAKIMWLLYEYPDTKFEGLATRFMDIRKRVYDFPDLGAKAPLICIPTTSGTGSEVTPFSVVTDGATGSKYPLADYSLTPNMAIIDPQLVKHMPKSLTANGGIDAVTHALESYVSAYATDYTRGLSLQALHLLFQYLPRAYKLGPEDPEAREKTHNAATIAGMAFANAFLGICHSMAHKLGARFDIAHGLANALMISHVILYNATDAPYKVVAFAQYKESHARDDYAQLATLLDCQGAKATNSKIEQVVCLVKEVEKIKASIGIPTCMKDAIGDRVSFEEYEEALVKLAEDAFDDQCTGTNPRYPLIEDLRQMMLAAWEPLDYESFLNEP
ncbi:hypothetical protein M9434_002305 [Picochlorum sp. BPE23]|nr:hypothetical protein M9434_002305 [Picochlorum sp. BPE23]